MRKYPDMTDTRPVLVALPLDHETDDILATASELGLRLEAPVVPVHALGYRPLESDAALAERVESARAEIEGHLAPLREIRISIADPVLERQRPDLLVVEEAQRSNAQLIVTGGGGPVTVRRWVVGSVAESIVRQAFVPVWIARGVVPTKGTVLCPVDLSPQSRVGLTAAIRMARVFDARLRVISVIEEERRSYIDAEELAERLGSDEQEAREQVETFLEAHDLAGLDVDVEITIGQPADRIVEASQDATLLVIASRGFDLLRPGTIGTVTERALRFSRCSALAVRDADSSRERRERSIQRIAQLHHRAKELLAQGKAQEALPLLQMAAGRAPANAAVQDSLALALDAVGRDVEAQARRQLAAMIRDGFQ